MDDTRTQSEWTDGGVMDEQKERGGVEGEQP